MGPFIDRQTLNGGNLEIATTMTHGMFGTATTSILLLLSVIHSIIHLTMAYFSIENIKVVNEAKAGVPIYTGVGFLDHMLDQLNSHAQVGVGLTVDVVESNDNENANANKIQKTQVSTDVSKNRNRLASSQSKSKSQTELFETVGTQLGKALKEMIASANPQNGHDGALTISRFCCPLDEALVECILGPSDNKEAGVLVGSLQSYTLAPFGKYPKQGRTHIGTLETAALKPFWQALAKESGLKISLQKLRGDNAHHIVESSFKAFSRALRNYLDTPQIWNSGTSENDKASVALARQGKIERQTKETSISVLLQLNGQSSGTKIDTGISIMDQFFTLLANEANMTLQISCKGDLWVDDHHTSEDVSIAVGQCLDQALGTKAGLNRMWLSKATLGQAQVEVTMDLSNRPCLRHNLDQTLEQAEYVDDSDTTAVTATTSKLSCEMFEHVLDSLVMNGRMTVHIMELAKGATVEETVLCTAMAFGKALRLCAMVDCRRAGQTASSKGTLSV
jgi:imidazoleglycerol-phosphate dehydratase